MQYLDVSLKETFVVQVLGESIVDQIKFGLFSECRKYQLTLNQEKI